MGKKTALYPQHLEAGAKMVDFAGWDMPLHYGSQLEEHKQVRSDAGMFDVSHMTVVDIEGAGAKAYLRRLVANNIDRLVPGKALYTCMLNPEGGVKDDLIIYYRGGERFRVVLNAATHDSDLAWLRRQAQGFDLTLTELQDRVLLAVQGPRARERVHALLDADARRACEDLGVFFAADLPQLFIARTGYTGEDGYEILMPAAQAAHWWQALYNAGVKPAGLGARDTLRLEAGMALYGSDMTETTTPLESGLAWTVAWEPAEREFIGRQALEAQRGDPALPRFVGLVLEGRGVLRSHQQVTSDGKVIGEITSGSFSPVLGKAIALARVAPEIGPRCEVLVRDKPLVASVVKPPFVRQGKSCIG